LLIADPHFGKAACFRRAGLPVPSGTTASDLQRLTGLIEQTGSTTLYVLGDWWHGPASLSETVLQQLRAWREQQPALAIELVRGNHDRHVSQPPADLAIEVREPPLPVEPFVLTHEPHDDRLEQGSDQHRGRNRRKGQKSGPVIAGHVHPGVRLNDAGASFRLPGFHVTDAGLVLPAFGSFTGMHLIQPDPGPGPGERLLPIAGGQVLGPSRRRSGVG